MDTQTRVTSRESEKVTKIWKNFQRLIETKREGRERESERERKRKVDRKRERDRERGER